jgi:hypothetical protein
VQLFHRLSARARWYEFAPEAALAIGLGLFTVTEPHAAASGFKSVRAVVLMVVVAIVWITGRAVTFAFTRRRIPRFALFGVGALAILKIVVLPAYTDHTVVETLVTLPAVTESIPRGPATSAPTDPVKIRAGSLVGIDHRATGTVNVYRQLDGRLVIGLEGFDIQPGPGYALYLVTGSDRHDHDGGTRLAALRGNRGTQFYATPNPIDVGVDPLTVLVWCETFDVPVANATPSPIGPG